MISPKDFRHFDGNECIGAHKYEDILIGIGPSAISYYPGLRLQNISSTKKWIEKTLTGKSNFDIDHCYNIHLEDMAFWSFPFFYQGLLKEQFFKLHHKAFLEDNQLKTFNSLVDEGFITQDENSFNLSLKGEVFLGCISEDLKKSNLKGLL